MSIKKKKRRKKRAPKQYEIPESQEEKAKVQYRDDFQTTVGKKLEDFGSKLEGKGRMIMYGFGALIVLGVIAGLFYMNQVRADNRAQAALGEAIKTSSARITEAPQPPDAVEKVFKTKKDRAEAAIRELQNVANTYGGRFAEKAAYLIAINRLDIDRAAGIKELEGIAGGSSSEASMAKYALAQTRVDDGKLDDAAKLYSELAQSSDPVISKVTVNTALAKVYEKQGKKKEAAAIYFEIAKAASEAKDGQDKPIPPTQAETEAKTKLEELDPEKAKEIKDPEPAEQALPGGVLN